MPNATEIEQIRQTEWNALHYEIVQRLVTSGRGHLPHDRF